MQEFQLRRSRRALLPGFEWEFEPDGLSAGDAKARFFEIAESLVTDVLSQLIGFDTLVMDLQPMDSSRPLALSEARLGTRVDAASLAVLRDRTDSQPAMCPHLLSFQARAADGPARVGIWLPDEQASVALADVDAVELACEPLPSMATGASYEFEETRWWHLWVPRDGVFGALFRAELSFEAYLGEPQVYALSLVPAVDLWSERTLMDEANPIGAANRHAVHTAVERLVLRFGGSVRGP